MASTVGAGRGGFEGVVDPATRRALLDLRRQLDLVAPVDLQTQIDALIARVETLEGAP